MPTIQELEQALIAADAAGDTEAATALASDIESLMQQTQPAPKELGVVGRAEQVAGGFNRGLGWPVDLVATGLRKVGVDVGDAPVGGSEWFVKHGMGGPEATDSTGRVLQRVGKEVGAAVLPAGAALTAAKVGVKGAALVKPTIDAARANPAQFVRAEAGASAGAGLGAGIATEVKPESKGAEIVGLLAGAIAPTAVAGSVRYLVRGGEGTRRAMEQSVKEFAEAGTTPTVGMATRRRFNEAVESGLSILPGSSGRMAAYSEKTARQLYDRVDEVTAGLAPIRSPDTAGVAIKQGIKGYVQGFKNTWRSLDKHVAKAVQPTDRIKMSNTRSVMVEMMDPGTATSYPELAAFVQRIDDLSRGGLMTYGDLRTFRTSVGSAIPDAYTRNLPKGKMSQLYDALAEDLRVHLKTRLHTSVSPAKSQVAGKALAALERSDKYYKAAMTRLDERLAPLTSHDIPERVFLALERSGHAGRTVINAAKRSIGKDNWDVVAATILQRMGKAPAGAQNAATEAFSANTFLTNWAKYGQNRGTLEALLQGTSAGPQFVKDMNAIAKVAERIREAGRVFSNPSGTARAIANVGLGTTVATGVMTGNLKSTGTVLGVALGANMSARAFTNPKFVRFLARSTEMPAARVPGLIARLGKELADEPEDVQVEIATFLDRLSDEFSAQAEEK